MSMKCSTLAMKLVVCKSAVLLSSKTKGVPSGKIPCKFILSCKILRYFSREVESQAGSQNLYTLSMEQITGCGQSRVSCRTSSELC